METPSFGEKLKQERERRNTSIEEIAERTKIALHFLQALESDNFDALPGRAFGKFYIRAYAEVLDFDPDPLIVEYDNFDEAQGYRLPAEVRYYRGETLLATDRFNSFAITASEPALTD